MVDKESYYAQKVKNLKDSIDDKSKALVQMESAFPNQRELHKAVWKALKDDIDQIFEEDGESEALESEHIDSNDNYNVAA